MSIRHGLLALLERSPTHGYQLRASFEDTTGGTWPLNIGQVYSTLNRLERDGLVRFSPAADRTVTTETAESTTIDDHQEVRR